MKFYLGTHMPHWLKDSTVPLFVSHRRLARNKGVPVAATSWALDSGGFTELSMFGEWRTTPAEYIDACRRYMAEIGNLDWCAPQDWMCEPFITAKTGLTVIEHQERTVDNYLLLRQLAPDVPFVPVLQGWELRDYVEHCAMYARNDVDLRAERTVGIGSVCRRQNTDDIGRIMSSLASEGLNLHGFGVKGAGIRRYGQMMASCDSMAWSYRGRRIKPCPHTGVTSCANCRPHALEWRHRALVPSVSNPQGTTDE
jgi:hypothetical protein